MKEYKKRICVLGWYGTETMGDRAILDGIFTIFSKTYGFCDFLIGSLFPILTERTLDEDGKIYSENAPNCTFLMFDEKNELRKNIDKSEVVIMGGGPIMELNELYLIYDGFKYAKRNHKKTIVCGCGLGPLKTKRLTEVAKKIIRIADLVIFRDEKSLVFANELTDKSKKYYALDDPAVISILQYKAALQQRASGIVQQNNELAVNFREPLPPYPIFMRESIFVSAQKLIEQACQCYERVRLVPMHSFTIGNDDRYYFSKLALNIDCENLVIMRKPLNLYELYSVYEKAEACVGMRYHSVVMQTLLNGNNYILDYTDKGKGKISGFIDMLGDRDFYTNRYTHIACEKLDIEHCLNVLGQNIHYNFNCERLESAINNYICLLLKL